MDYFRWNGLRSAWLCGALALLGGALIACSPAWAGLGSDNASITADLTHFRASDKVISHPLYDVPSSGAAA